MDFVTINSPPGVSSSDDLAARIEFYGLGLVSRNARRYVSLGSPFAEPILVYGRWNQFHRVLRRIRGGVFWVDEQLNPEAGWQWCDLALYVYLRQGNRVPDRRGVLAKVGGELAKKFQQCYLFGTGPSLAHAMTRDWGDGIRIVCNTVVRDSALWKHINPHFIVAGDGIYHFGYTPHARAFRRDLALRLTETDTYFVFPERFYPVVEKDLKTVLGRVIPVPVESRRSLLGPPLDSFTLPGLPNVLNMLLLPLGCALSKNIGLWGFDGRAPKDTLFWANSNAQSYPELMDSLRVAHPAFFNHNVPKDDPTKYVKAVHGDLLEGLLSTAEGAGWKFEMLHKSWTPTLAKREKKTL